MLHIYESDDMTELHTSLCDSLVYAKGDELDMANSVDVQQHNVVALAESCAWDFNLQDLWLTRSRWTTMVRQYINPVALDIWLNTIEAKLKGRKRGVSILRTNEVQQRSSPRASTDGIRISRAWGSCMLAIGYRALPRPQITLHSRTSYLGYIAALDMSVAYVCAKLVADRVGLAVEDIQFVWHLEAAQFHGFKSLAYLLNDDERREDFLDNHVGDGTRPDDAKLKRDQPGLYICAKWMKSFLKEDREGLRYGDMKFSQNRRVRKRYHTEILGYEYGEPFEGGGNRASHSKRYHPLPRVDVDTLTFDQLYSPAARRGTKVSWDEANASKVDTTDELTDDELGG